MVVDGEGKALLAVNEKGTLVKGLNSLADSRRLSDNPMILVLDQKHFMAAVK